MMHKPPGLVVAYIGVDEVSLDAYYSVDEVL